MVFAWLKKFQQVDPGQFERYDLHEDFCSDPRLDEIGGSELREYIMLLERFTTEPSLFFNVDGTLKRKAELCATLEVVARKSEAKIWTKRFGTATFYYILPFALAVSASTIATFVATVSVLALNVVSHVAYEKVLVEKDVKNFERTKRRLERWDRGVKIQQLPSIKQDNTILEERKSAFAHTDFNILWVLKPGGDPRVESKDILKARQYWSPTRFKILLSKFGGVNGRAQK